MILSLIKKNLEAFFLTIDTGGNSSKEGKKENSSFLLSYPGLTLLSSKDLFLNCTTLWRIVKDFPNL